MNQYWCVKDIGGKHFLTLTIAFSRKYSIDAFIDQNTYLLYPVRTWKEYYRRGYRCVKVRIEEVR